MTIDEAIKIKEEMQSLGLAPYDDASWEADNLSIEALKAIKNGREGLRTEFFTPLYGETKD